jgi:hypothetical protein
LDQANRLNCLKLIQSCIGGTLLDRSKYAPNTFRLIVDTFNKTPALINYFDLFKPQTTKLFVGYIRYKRIYNLWLNHPGKLDEIKPQINKTIEMNKKLLKRYSPINIKEKIKFEKHAE